MDAQAGGGFLILDNGQISNLDLLCLIKRTFPGMRLITLRGLPPDVESFFRIKRPGILARYTRQPGG